MDVKKVMMVSVVGLLIAILIFGGTLYFSVFKGNDNDSAKKNIKTYTYEAGEFATNIGGTRNFFKGKITIETTDKKMPEKLTEENVLVRDSIIGILIGQNPKEIVSKEGMDKLKKDIVNKLNEKFETDSILQIYFSDYVIQ
ncbi:MAG: flagellar basal body-associated FliL family protein [Peptostreptococcaceae bacterium]|jgi:flagellar FliL protein|nr:flagellar basal body-associated FliL family protein [Peptostreptococcaceae bacterium]